MKYVVDASVAVEFLLKTSAGQVVAGIIRDADLAAPELLDVEVLSVLRREVRLKRLGRERAEQALDDLLDWDVDRLSHRALLRRAWKHRDNVSAYDAMYVATAELLGCPVLTVDGPLARVPSLTITVQNVRGPTS